VTFRLYDWNRVEPMTGQPRELQVDQALACIDFSEGRYVPVTPAMEAPKPVRRSRLFQCEHFWLCRVRGQSPFPVGAAGLPRMLVCIEGAGQVEHDRATYTVRKGDVVLLPAILGECTFQPRGAVTVLEIGIPE
jgi:mannose-6-phosphate isomerase